MTVRAPRRRRSLVLTVRPADDIWMTGGISIAAAFGSTDEALGLMENILESSTEYSIVATDLDGTILLWNAGARLR